MAKSKNITHMVNRLGQRKRFSTQCRCAQCRSFWRKMQLEGVGACVKASMAPCEKIATIATREFRVLRRSDPAKLRAADAPTVRLCGGASGNGCGRDTTRIVSNCHMKYARCSWSTPYCANCFALDEKTDGKVGPLGDCVFLSQSETVIIANE